MLYFKVNAQWVDDPDPEIPGKFIIPDTNIRYRVIRPYRREDVAFIVECDSAPAVFIETVDAGAAVITTALAWYAAHPADDPGWKDAGEI